MASVPKFASVPCGYPRGPAVYPVRAKFEFQMRTWLIPLLMIAAAALPARAGSADPPWYREAVFYGIHPSSFQDSNGDGVGDFVGITRQLDYLRTLDVDAICLTPFDPGGGQPGFDPRWGDPEEFDRLVAAAHRKKLRVVIELIIDSAPTTALAAARFWFDRGVDGILLTPVTDQASKVDWRALIATAQEPRPGGPRVMVWGGLQPAPPGAAISLNLSLLAIRELWAPALQKALAPVGSFRWLNATTTARTNRALHRLRDAGHQELIAKLLACLLLSLNGNPFLYYGEELGLAAESSATPMSWTEESGAGFTVAGREPWRPLDEEARQRNVAVEGKSRISTLGFYKRLLNLRRESSALRDGDLQWLPGGDQVLMFKRGDRKQTMIVALNLGAEPQTVNVPAALVPDHRGLQMVLSNIFLGQRVVAARKVPLQPYEAVVMEVVER